MPSVTFALRSDARTKPGGDSTKVDRYQRKLREMGWQTRVVMSSIGLRDSSPDIVHLTNLDLPRENLEYVDAAEKLGVPVVLSTIRHPLDGIRAMYRSGEDSMYVQTRRLGISPERAVGVREQIKLARRKQFAAAARPGRYLDLQSTLLARVDAYLPMASGEAAAIEQDFPRHQNATIVRNGLSFRGPHDEAGISAPKRYDVVSVGRIEPRKNSLALARALHALKIRGVFIGAVNRKHEKYAKDFERLAAASPWVAHLGKVDHEDVPTVLSQARVYVNPAWFEVASQADVEAAAVGLPVVTTVHSYIQDALGDDVPTLDPEQLALSPSETLQSALSSARTCDPPRARSWDECGIELDALYRQLMNN